MANPTLEKAEAKVDAVDVFVSYASEDLERVKPLIAAFEEHGWKVWWDKELVVGPSYEDKIEEALEVARCVVVVWSSHSIKSQWVRTEAHEGLEREILVPLLLDDVKPPLAYRISQTATMFDWPDQSGQLENVVAGITGLVGHATQSDQEQSFIQPERVLPAKMSRLKVVSVVMIGLLAIGALLMTVDKSRVWITQTAIGLAFDAATMFSSSELEVELGIAVLPFVNMSSDAENEYFSDGISEEILNALVKTNRMPVIARTSSFYFKGKNQDIKEIGRTLGVTHILEGSVRKANNNVRITAQLVDATTGAHLWSETYDRELLDVFAIQDEIASEIVRQIGLALTPGDVAAQGVRSSRGTTSAEAYDLYLQATHLSNSGNPFETAKAIPLLERAIALDSEYADAWVSLGIAYLGTDRIRAEVFPIAMDAFRTALKIDPGHAQAMGALGWVLMHQEFKWNEGAQLMRQSLALNPLNAQLQALYGWFLFSTRQEEADSVLEKAYRLNPLDPTVIFLRASQLFFSGRQLDAASLMEMLLIQNRKGYRSNVLVAFFTVVTGRPNIAEEYLAKARDVVGADYPGIRVVDYFIAGNKGEIELLEEIKAELFASAKHTHIPFLLEVGWNEDEIVEIYNIAIEHRDEALMSKLFAPKPLTMPVADWQRIRKLTRVAEVETGTASNSPFLRTDAEKEQLQSTAITLSEESLDLYVGVYEVEREGGGQISIERSGKELWLSANDRSFQLVPIGHHRFEDLEIKNSLEFVVESDIVTKIVVQTGQVTQVWIKVE